jgi:uncharacterized protein YbjT (DUF2867 family)
MATIFVTGAGGFVGSHVVPALLEGGHRVLALVRGGDAATAFLEGVPPRHREAVEVRHGDLTNRESLSGAVVGADTVVHLAAIPRDLDGGASLRLVNTEGTRNLVAAAKEAGIQRFIHLGAMGVKDDPNLHYASSKAKGEAIVRESGLDWTILKPSLLWGERDGFFNIIAGLIRMSPLVVPVPGSGESRFQPLAVTDLATILARTLDDPSTIGKTYELGGPRYWTYREITREVLRGMGSRRVIVPMPVFLISLVAGAAERVRLPFPVATDQLRQLRLDNIGPLDTIEREFGFTPQSMEGRLTHLRRKPGEQAVVPA